MKFPSNAAEAVGIVDSEGEIYDPEFRENPDAMPPPCADDVSQILEVFGVAA